MTLIVIVIVECIIAVIYQYRRKFDICDNYAQKGFCGIYLGSFLRSFGVIDGTNHEREESSTRLRYSSMITFPILQIAQRVSLFTPFTCAPDLFWNRIAPFNYIL